MELTPAPLVAKSKPYPQGPEPGGRLPDLGGLFSETLSEFVDNIGPYLLAGLGFTVVVVPVAFIAVIGGYMLLGTLSVVAMVAGSLLGALAAQISEQLGALVVGMSSFMTLGVFVAGLLGLIALIGAVLAPLQASLVRAVAAHQRGERELDFTSAFTTVTQDLPKVLAVSSVVSMLAIVGLVMCYVPALIVLVLFGFAVNMVALHREGALGALRTSARHAMDHPSFHAPFALATVVVSMVASNIPVVGVMFGIALQVRAYRRIFGDGEAPVLQIASS